MVDKPHNNLNKITEYDVALSFAGEDRKYVEEVAANLLVELLLFSMRSKSLPHQFNLPNEYAYSYKPSINLNFYKLFKGFINSAESTSGIFTLLLTACESISFAG